MTDAVVYYKSPLKLAKATVGLLWTQFALTAVGLVVTLVTFGDVDVQPESELQTLALLGAAALMFLIIPVFLATVVVYCMWFYRVQGNLRAIGGVGLSRSAGWAVGSFFVPFANLVVPFWSAQEAWRVTDPDADPRDEASWKALKTPQTMSLWWAAWVVGNIVNNAAMRLSVRADTDVQMRTADTLSVTGDVLSFLAILFGVSVIRSLSARQDAKATQLFGPPPVAVAA